MKTNELSPLDDDSRRKSRAGAVTKIQQDLDGLFEMWIGDLSKIAMLRQALDELRHATVKGTPQNIRQAVENARDVLKRT